MSFPACCSAIQSLRHQCTYLCYASYRHRLKQFMEYLISIRPVIRTLKFALDIDDPVDGYRCLLSELIRVYLHLYLESSLFCTMQTWFCFTLLAVYLLIISRELSVVKIVLDKSAGAFFHVSSWCGCDTNVRISFVWPHLHSYETTYIPTEIGESDVHVSVCLPYPIPLPKHRHCVDYVQYISYTSWEAWENCTAWQYQQPWLNDVSWLGRRRLLFTHGNRQRWRSTRSDAVDRVRVDRVHTRSAAVDGCSNRFECMQNCKCRRDGLKNLALLDVWCSNIIDGVCASYNMRRPMLSTVCIYRRRCSNI